MHHGSLSARTRGFTLVEVVVAITIGTIMVGFSAMFMTAPIDSYLAQTRRAQLTDAAETISRNLDTDLRIAVPDSVRLAANGNFRLLEMLATDGTAAQYRPMLVPPDGPATLTFIAPDPSFSTIGRFLPNLTAQLVLPGHRLLIAPQLAPPATNLYLPGVISPAGITISPSPLIPGEATVQPAATPFNFTSPSATSRVFLVSGVVAYLCDLNAQTLRKYTGFPITPTALPHDTANELNLLSTTNVLIANNVTACAFTRHLRTPGARSLTSFQITIARNGEVLRIFDQIAQERGP